LALDGMRALAVMTVMLFHLFALPKPQWNPLRPSGGFLTLDIFYVLSGFLITSLLLGELDKRGRVSLPAFYARRALRLFPALAVLLLVAGLAAAIWSGQSWSHPTLLGLPWVLLYVGNWNVVLYGGTAPLGALGQTWSLSVEEQFYLLWPLIMLAVVRRFTNRVHIAYALVGLALAEMLYRYLAIEVLGWAARDRIYFGTDTHSDGLLLGCALAFYLSSRQGREFSDRFARRLDVATIVASVALILLVMRMTYVAASGVWFGISAATLCTSIIVLNLVTRPYRPLQLVLELRPLQWVGKRAYGLYLWQDTVFYLASGINRHGLGDNAYHLVLFVVPFGFAALSYRFVEQPFLRRKRTFEKVHLEPTSEPAVAAVAS
jgi:peptidoglycan/LPS O-acetylase OafA/YrhL